MRKKRELTITYDTSLQELGHEERIKDHIYLVRDRLPEWWTEQMTAAKGCPALQSWMKNSIAVEAPTDLVLVYGGDGMLSTMGTATYFKHDGKVKETLVDIGQNGVEESGNLYKYMGGVSNLKVEWMGATITAYDKKSVNTIWMPATYITPNILKSKFQAATAPVNFPPEFLVNILAFVIVSAKGAPDSKVIIKKGTPLGVFYIPEGITSLKYEAKKLVYRYESKVGMGVDYKKHSQAACPYQTSKSWWNSLVSKFK